MLSDGRESRNTAIVRRTAELLASEAPLADLFPGFAAELAGRFGAAAVNLALGPEPGELLLYKERASAAAASDQTRIAAALTGETVASARAIAVPLRYAGRIVGALGIRAAEGVELQIEDVDALRACALYLAIRVHEERLRAERDRLAALAGTDALTGIPNRRAFDERLDAEWRRAQREEQPVAAIVLDIDLFKSFNDRYGHLAGDLCLKRVAATLREALRRPGDLVARVGGEEFCAILPGTDLVGAVTIAEGMRGAVWSQGIPHADNPAGILTVSAGVAALRSGDAAEATALYAAADGALYVAKAAGRNHVATAAGAV